MNFGSEFETSFTRVKYKSGGLGSNRLFCEQYTTYIKVYSVRYCNVIRD